MSIRRAQVRVTGPAGTAVSSPIAGEILEIRYDGTALNAASATADWTFSRTEGGGTILAITDRSGPWSFAPRQAMHTTAAGTLTDASMVGPVPVAGNVRVVLAQGGTATDSVSIFYRE